MTLTACQIYSNTAAKAGGGINKCCGPTLIVVDSTVSGNQAGTNGGGIHNQLARSASLTNSTLSGNSAGHGGGVFADGSGKLGLTHVTLSHNESLTGTSSISITSNAIVTMQNTIIANSIYSGGIGVDCAVGTGTFFDGGYNLVEDGSCITATTSITGDPGLAPLGDYGGDTETHALLPSSPALDHIPAGICVLPTDQRGIGRPQNIDCDIGAVEAAYYTLTVSLAGNGSGSVSGTGIDCGNDCDEVYFEGTAVTLTAATGDFSSFGSWSGDCTNTTVDCVVTMNGDKSVIATFNKYILYLPLVMK